MEDFIYLILLIAWIAFAFYRKSQKTKAAAPPRPRPQEAENPEKTIGDIIFGENWHIEEEPEPLPESGNTPVLSTIRHPDSQEGVSLEKLEVKYARDQKPKAEVPPDMIREDEETDEEARPEFSLRNAVIYDAILNRPYG